MMRVKRRPRPIDIANEMDISPGNLYYHFKGKDQIIAEIFQQYELALSGTLTAPIERPLSATGNVEENWYYLYVVMEEMYQYRFLYSQPGRHICSATREFDRGFKRLIQLKRAALLPSARHLLQQSVI